MTTADIGALAASSTTQVPPFGLVIEAERPTPLAGVPPAELAALADANRVLVLRGFTLRDTDDFAAYSRTWGELLSWDFGEVFDLVTHEDPKNYLFTPGPVPFHWDGAFAHSTPRYFIFRCLTGTQGDGGETVFSDTTQVYRDAPEELRRQWDGISITYSTDKLAHYGGKKVTEPLVSRHRRTGETTLRFAEPLPPEEYLNPLFLEVSGLPEDQVPEFLTSLAERLHRPEYCYAHAWQAGDIVIVDNDALVHGRNAFTGPASRHLQRIQVI